jgi:hypothetical protein
MKGEFFMSKITQIKRDEIRREVESEGYILKNEYDGINSILKTICPRGHERNCKLTSFRKYQCGICLDEDAREIARSEILSSGYKILSEPKYAKEQWELECQNGHYRKVSIGNFRNHNCPKCNDRRNYSYTYEEAVEIFKKENCILLTPKESFINCKSDLRYLCHCGNISVTSLDAFNNGNNKGCHKCQSRINSGENHPNWKGGITPEYTKLRTSPEYIKWRNEVFNKNDYTCQCCLNRGGKLQAHHINNFSTYEDERFDVNNGITLCVECHAIGRPNSFHTRYGSRENNKEQLIEYINERRKELNIFLLYI